jgi:hypothetical protein
MRCRCASYLSSRVHAYGPKDSFVRPCLSSPVRCGRMTRWSRPIGSLKREPEKFEWSTWCQNLGHRDEDNRQEKGSGTREGSDSVGEPRGDEDFEQPSHLLTLAVALGDTTCSQGSEAIGVMRQARQKRQRGRELDRQARIKADLAELLPSAFLPGRHRFSLILALGVRQHHTQIVTHDHSPHHRASAR